MLPTSSLSCASTHTQVSFPAHLPFLFTSKKHKVPLLPEAYTATLYTKTVIPIKKIAAVKTCRIRKSDLWRGKFVCFTLKGVSRTLHRKENRKNLVTLLYINSNQITDFILITLSKLPHLSSLFKPNNHIYSRHFNPLSVFILSISLYQSQQPKYCNPCDFNSTPRHEGVLGSGGTANAFLPSALDGGEWPDSFPGRFTAGKRVPVPTGEEAGWIPEPVWTR